MKTKLIIFFVLLSNITFCQKMLIFNEASHNFDMSLIEREFEKIYLNYIDSVFKIKKTHSKELDSLSYCQLNYLKNLTIITHEQNGELSSIGKRFKKYFKSNNYHVAEIVGLIASGSDEKNIAKKTFNGFINSAGHKNIIDDPNFSYYNFKFCYNKDRNIICVGTFTNIDLSDKIRLN